jgi:hypothetical protein
LHDTSSELQSTCVRSVHACAECHTHLLLLSLLVVVTLAGLCEGAHTSYCKALCRQANAVFKHVGDNTTRISHARYTTDSLQDRFAAYCVLIAQLYAPPIDSREVHQLHHRVHELKQMHCRLHASVCRLLPLLVHCCC